MLHRLLSPLSRLLRPLVELGGSPRGLWYVIGAFMADSIAYFGILTLMTTYLSADLRWPDAYASIGVSIFTMAVTLFMLGLGSFAESFGLRRAIAIALLLNTVGRAIYCVLPGCPAAFATVGVLGSLLLVAAGSGILMPVCYSGVKQFTNEKTNSMGYAMIYALMNLGIFLVGALSAWIRPGVQDVLNWQDVTAQTAISPLASGIGAAGGPALGSTVYGVSLASQAVKPAAANDPILCWLTSFSNSGVNAVNWVCCGVTVLTLLIFLMLMTRTVQSGRLRPESSATPATGPRPGLAARFRSYLSEGPFGNARFLFFIFMLLPVQTLFAHQWLTMPEYILRAYPKDVNDKMEWLVNWINPLIIFFCVPLAAMLTKRFHVFTVMIVGSFVSAAPTFLLSLGPDAKTLIAYFVLFSLGEALWQPRFLEYASELAPPGRVAQYMGLAQVPWLLAKGTTGFYSGYLLATYCPKDTPPENLQTGTLWFIYACIAMTSPIGLWLAREWVQRGLHQPAPQVKK
jgi:proton-dependent oligopeptide transporter, POT family